MKVTRQHVITGTLWTLLQRWGVRLTTLIVFIVLGRNLDPEDFGVVALAGVFVGLFNVFSDFGLSTYLVQASSVDQRIKSTVFWCGLAFSVVLAGTLIAASPLISGLFDAPDLRFVLMALASSIVLTAFTGTQTAILKRALDFRTIAIRSLVATFTAAVVAIGLALAGQGVWALVAQSLVFNATSAVVLWTATGWRPDFTFDLATARHALAFGGSVVGVQLVSQVRHRADALVIGAVLGTTALGFWTVATRILAVIFESAVQVISAVSTPTFARLRAEPARLQRAYRTATTTSLALIAPILAILGLSAPWMIPLIFGEKWADSAPLSQILCVSAAFSTMVYFDRGLMLSLGRARTELVLTSLTTGVGVALVVALAPRGLEAVATAVVLRNLIAWPIRVRTSTRALGISRWLYVKAQLRTLAVGLATLPPSAVLSWLASRHLGQGAAVAAATISVLCFFPLLLWLLNRPVAVESLALMRSVLRHRRKPSDAGSASQPATSGQPSPLGDPPRPVPDRQSESSQDVRP